MKNKTISFQICTENLNPIQLFSEYFEYNSKKEAILNLEKCATVSDIPLSELIIIKVTKEF